MKTIHNKSSFVTLVALFLFSISSPLLADLSDGLVAYYPFNGNANDASGNGWHSTFESGAAICASTPDLGEAACLDGVDDYLTLPAQALSGLPQGTVFAWVYLDKYERFNGSTIILSKGDPSWTDFAFAITPVVYALIGNETMAGSTSIPIGVWVSVAFTWDGTHWRLYANGQLDAEIQRATGLATDGSTIYLGHHEHCCVPFYTQGRFDEVRIYNRALSGSEVAELHQSGSLPPGNLPPEAQPQQITVASSLSDLENDYCGATD